MDTEINHITSETFRDYKPTLKYKPADFDDFWARQKAEMHKIDPVVTVTWIDYPVPSVDVAEIKFTSWDGTVIHGILVKPKAVETCPVMMSIHGYTGSCGLPIDYLKWTALGVAVYAFDVRGQGNSADHAIYQNGSRIPGWMLHGILNPEDYYYTNVYRDSILQLNWIKSSAAPIKHTKLGVVGSSQGGGIALSVAGISGEVDFVISDYPFIAHFERALAIASSGPYREIVNYFKMHDPQYKKYNRILETLGYIDAVHFCELITCPILMQIGLKDTVTPPLTVFAAFNHLGSKNKEIEVYPDYEHEINMNHEEKKLAFIVENITD